MKRGFKLYLTKSDMSTIRTVYEEIMRLDPLAEFEGAAGTGIAWVFKTVLTDNQLAGVTWVVRAVQASKGLVLGRRFRVSFNNKLKIHSQFEIQAMQEWINVDHWGRQFAPAENIDLDPVHNLRGNNEPIGDIQYELRIFVYDVAKDRPRATTIGRYKTLDAALDTLIDMGIIDDTARQAAIQMLREGSYGGDL